MDSPSNLLVRLHKCAVRQDESFLTEAFVHLGRVLLESDPALAIGLFALITHGRLALGAQEVLTVAIETQVTGTDGRTDVEIRTPTDFTIVEVKSWDLPNADQLKRYRARL